MVLTELKRRKKLIFDQVDYKISDPKVWAQIQKTANQAMRVEVLPSLGQGRIRASSWNPLRIDPTGEIKLWTQDKLALEIMKNPQLLAMTQQVVLDAIMDVAVTVDPQRFLQNALDSLKVDDGRD